MYTYPHKIDNGHGEEITFVKRVQSSEGDYLEIENLVQPGSGPPMHVHHRQAESLTIVNGKMATQVLGEEPVFHTEGETAVFEAGVPHKFWNNGDKPLLCRGWVKPADNMEYFLTEIYKSTKENGGRPGNFDSAYLLTRYKSEFDMYEIPGFVKKVIFPLVLFFGKMTGKHKKFANAPEPIK
jgi:mannose-6-phosphate isomerase-like protein (cupin superfamily)